jgi:hypothetical protein
MAVSAFHELACVKALGVHHEALIVGRFGDGILEVTAVGITGLRP